MRKILFYSVDVAINSTSGGLPESLPGGTIRAVGMGCRHSVIGISPGLTEGGGRHRQIPLLLHVQQFYLFIISEHSVEVNIEYSESYFGFTCYVGKKK